MASEKRINSVWAKARPIKGKNSDVLRKDAYGNTIIKSCYGMRGEYGWEIDHKTPLAKGGSNNAQNRQPLHWRENRIKSDKYPYKPI